MWEMGIELCKEITLQYETETFEYTQLSTILVRFFVDVRTSARFYSEQVLDFPVYVIYCLENK
jgi:hypothetical protein